MTTQLGTATHNRADSRLTLETSGPVDVAVRDVWGRDAFMRRSERIGESPARAIPGPYRVSRAGVPYRWSSPTGTGTAPAASEQGKTALTSGRVTTGAVAPVTRVNHQERRPSAVVRDST